MPRPMEMPDDKDTSFGARLIRYRDKRAFWRKDLVTFLRGKEFDIRELAIARWERNGRLPQNPELYRFLVTEFERFRL
jgi:hypothetical protein